MPICWVPSVYFPGNPLLPSKHAGLPWPARTWKNTALGWAPRQGFCVRFQSAPASAGWKLPSRYVSTRWQPRAAESGPRPSSPGSSTCACANPNPPSAPGPARASGCRRCCLLPAASCGSAVRGGNNGRISGVRAGQPSSEAPETR